jgi:pyocin large subunit-like protein
MTQEKTGPDATPRIGLDLGRQIFDDTSGGPQTDRQSGASEESIRQRAYEIWENEGRAGDPHDHWYRAERELNGSSQEQSFATVEDAPPAATVGAMEAISEQPTEEELAPKKPRRKRSS